MAGFSNALVDYNVGVFEAEKETSLNSNIFISEVISNDITKKMAQPSLQKPVLRYPRLDTVLMVEEFIKECDGEFKKKALWEHLPKKTMYQTFCVIVDYLLYSHKISIDAEGKIGWIYHPELARKYYARKDLGRRT